MHLTNLPAPNIKKRLIVEDANRQQRKATCFNIVHRCVCFVCLYWRLHCCRRWSIYSTTTATRTPIILRPTVVAAFNVTRRIDVFVASSKCILYYERTHWLSIRVINQMAAEHRQMSKSTPLLASALETSVYARPVAHFICVCINSRRQWQLLLFVVRVNVGLMKVYIIKLLLRFHK